LSKQNAKGAKQLASHVKKVKMFGITEVDLALTKELAILLGKMRPFNGRCPNRAISLESN